MGGFFPLRDPVDKMPYSLIAFTIYLESAIYLNFVLKEKHLCKITKNQMLKKG